MRFRPELETLEGRLTPSHVHHHHAAHHAATHAALAARTLPAAPYMNHVSASSSGYDVEWDLQGNVVAAFVWGSPALPVNIAAAFAAHPPTVVMPDVF